MASKTTKPRFVAPPSNKRADFVGYINLTLTDKDKEDYEGWIAEDGISAEGYYASLEQGYVFSIKQDTQNNSYMCSVSQFNVGRPDSGCIYTARSDNPDSALLKAIYVVSRKMAFDISQGYVNRRPADAF